MKTKSHLLSSLVLLLVGGVSASAQDTPVTQDTSSSGQIDLALFTAYPWHVNLGTEFAGAKGSFAVATDDSASVGKLTYDFTGGGLYVAGMANVTIPDGVSEFRFRVKSASPQKIIVRLFDSTNQCHQYTLPYTDAGNWQLLRVDVKDPSPLSFGGAKDHIIHFPINQVSLAVEKGDGTTQGEALFKDGVALK